MAEKKRNRSEYMAKWRNANPDKVAEIQARYWAKKVEESKAITREAVKNGSN